MVVITRSRPLIPCCWQQARRSGLTAQAPADVLGEARASLYRWQKQPSPKSTRPHTVRKSKPEPKLALAVECLRKQHPMWGKDKLAPLLWKQDFDCSVSKVGRILKNSSNAAPFNPCRFCAKARNMRPASTNGSMPYAC